MYAPVVVLESAPVVEERKRHIRNGLWTHQRNSFSFLDIPKITPSLNVTAILVFVSSQAWNNCRFESD